MTDAILLALTQVMDATSLVVIGIGVLIGFVTGVIPGVGTITAFVVLLPFTIGMDSVDAILLFAAVTGTSQFAGSLPAILLNTPGTTSNACTTLDGFPMNLRGESSRAIGISAASAMAGTVGGALLILVLLPVARPLILAVGPAELFWIAVIGIFLVAIAARENLLRGLISASFGFFLSLVGFSGLYAQERLTMGSVYLWDGVPLVPLTVGLFALMEAVRLLSHSIAPGDGERDPALETGVRPDEHWFTGFSRGWLDVLRRPALAIRSVGIGAAVGLVPGAGGPIANYLSYVVAKQRSRTPEEFGRGSIEGLIASEVANDAKDGGAILPTMAFGIPGSPEMAILLGMLLIHGLTPGPLLFRNELHLPIAFLIALFAAQAAMSILAIGIVPVASRLAVLCSRRGDLVGYAVVVVALTVPFFGRENMWDLVLVFLCGLLALGMKRFRFPVIPLLVGFFLGPILEQQFHLTIRLKGESVFAFVDSVPSIVMVSLLLVLVVTFVAGKLRTLRAAASPASDIAPDPAERVVGVVLLFFPVIILVSAFRWPGLSGLFPIVSSVFAIACLLMMLLGRRFPAIMRVTGGVEVLPIGGEQTELDRRTVRALAPSVVLLCLVIVVGHVAGTLLLVLGLLALRRASLKSLVAFAVGAAVIVVLGADLLAQLPLWEGVAPELVPGVVGGGHLPVFF
jgi:putative tricarboxylic transport membrane protein